jgi:hypothetical protein
MEIPESVDARDGFDEGIQTATEEVEHNLAETVDKLQIKADMRVASEPPRDLNIGAGGSSKELHMQMNPAFESILQQPGLMDQLGSSDGINCPRSTDMIPALRGLSDVKLSHNSATDVSMVDADSVLGNRGAEEKEVQRKKTRLVPSSQLWWAGGSLEEEG